MAKYLRCYMCSDLHAANRTYRKLLNAVKMNVYEANVVLIAGDLTGKAIVPIISQGNGRYTASFLDQNYLIESASELEKVEGMISDIGYYPYVTSPEEVAELNADTGKMRELFRQQMIQRVGEWVALAEERIGKSGVQFYMMPGNDDDTGVDAMIARWDPSEGLRKPTELIVVVIPLLTYGARFKPLSTPSDSMGEPSPVGVIGLDGTARSFIRPWWSKRVWTSCMCRLTRSGSKGGA